MQAGKIVYTRTWATILVGVFCLCVCVPAAFAKAPKVYTIKLPKESCNVKERWKGKSRQTVIHIQDAHNNNDAQENIAAIIETLVTDNDISLVGVEGASSEIDLSSVKKFPSEKGLDVATGNYVSRGIISGAEKAAIVSNESFDMVGVENRDIFRKNFRAYYGTTLKREDILEQIEEIENILNDLKTPFFSEELITFDALVTSWERGERGIVDFLFKLDPPVRDMEIDTLDYVHYAAFQEVLQMKMQVDAEAYAEERPRFMQAIAAACDEKAGDSYREMQKNLRDRCDAFMRSELSERECLEYAKYCARKLKVPLKEYPNVRKQIKYLQAFGRLDMAGVVQDATRLAHIIRLSLATTERAETLVKMCRDFTVLKHVVGLTATNEMMQYYRTHAETCNFDVILAYVATHGAEAGLAVPHYADGRDLRTLMRYAQHFYTGAELRNTSLVDTLIDEMDSRHERTAVLVSGGFHTKGLVEEFQKRDISYLVVTPKISDFVVNDGYAAKMHGQLMALSPQLVGYINLLLSDPENVQGGYGTVKKLQNNISVLAAVNTLMSGVTAHGITNADNAIADDTAALMNTFTDDISSENITGALDALISASHDEMNTQSETLEKLLRGTGFLSAARAFIERLQQGHRGDVYDHLASLFGQTQYEVAAQDQYFAVPGMGRLQHADTVKVNGGIEAHYQMLSDIVARLGNKRVNITVCIDPKLKEGGGQDFLDTAVRVLSDLGGEAITVVYEDSAWVEDRLSERRLDSDRTLVLKHHESEYPADIVAASFDLSVPDQRSVFNSVLMKLLQVVTAPDDMQKDAFNALTAYLQGGTRVFDVDAFVADVADLLNKEVAEAHRAAMARTSA